MQLCAPEGKQSPALFLIATRWGARPPSGPVPAATAGNAGFSRGRGLRRLWRTPPAAPATETVLLMWACARR
eukprot:9264514-Pyramimonas_sp.AAC.1